MGLFALIMRCWLQQKSLLSQCYSCLKMRFGACYHQMYNDIVSTNSIEVPYCTDSTLEAFDQDWNSINHALKTLPFNETIFGSDSNDCRRTAFFRGRVVPCSTLLKWYVSLINLLRQLILLLLVFSFEFGMISSCPRVFLFAIHGLPQLGLKCLQIPLAIYLCFLPSCWGTLI